MTTLCREKDLNGRRYRCYFELTLHVIGGKWKPIILYQLAISGVMRFSDMRRSMPDVTERMLSRQLKELAKDGLVHREVYKEVPPRVEYWLTDLGKTLMPILASLRDWGAEFERQTLARSGRSGAFDEPGYEPADLPPACAVLANTVLAQNLPAKNMPASDAPARKTRPARGAPAAAMPQATGEPAL